MMKKIKSILLVILLGGIIFAGCEQSEIMSYQDQEYTAGVNFIADSTTYSFLGNPDDEYIEEIPVRIMGDSADHDRQFEVEVIDSLTTAESSDYEIVEGIVPAGAFEGNLAVRLFRKPKLSEERVSLHLRVGESEDFESGNIEDNLYLLSWTNQVVVPAWNFYGFFFCANSSTTAYQIIVQLTGLTELTTTELGEYGQNGLTAMGREFGDYIKQYNEDHPDNPLRHEDGPAEGELIEPIHYTQSQYD